MKDYSNYLAFKQIAKTFDVNKARTMLEDAAMCPSFSDNPQDGSWRIVVWEETSFLPDWYKVASNEENFYR